MTTSPSPLVLYVIYGLHAFSAITGLLTPAFIVTAFLTGWPSLLAVLLSYFDRGSKRDSYLYSHYQYLIKTFWLALLWLIISGVLMVSVIAFFAGLAILYIVGIWELYRLFKGLSLLIDEKPMPLPEA